MGRYLFRFAQIREDFRLEEIRAVCKLANIAFPEEDAESYSNMCPFWIANLPGEEHVKKILERAILVREIVELLGCAEGLEGLLEEVRAIPASYYDPYRHAPFCFVIDDYSGKIEQEEKVALINRFSFMPLQGAVSIGNAQVTFSLHFDPPQGRCYFGRLVGRGRRDLIDRFSLKRRHYLGTTSMDAELSLIMSNLALVREGRLVYDPFAGTGSLLCTAAVFGAFTLGSDIDGRQMRGIDGRSMQSNLLQYGLQRSALGSLVFDILHHPWRAAFQVDAIIADPPYGVRAGAKKIGRRDGKSRRNEMEDESEGKGKEHEKEIHVIEETTNEQGETMEGTGHDGVKAKERMERYPMTVPYEMDELARDLHKLALLMLRPGGRLVYWYPTEEIAYEERPDRERLCQMLPRVVGLELIAAMPQRCRQFDRWLIVQERTD